MAGTKLNLEGFNKFVKALQSTAKVKVGVLAAENNRIGSGPTNAEIGAKHEFGIDGMPMRSFLRAPLTNNLGKSLEKYGQFNEDLLNLVVESKSISPWLKLIGVIGEKVVKDAFAQQGPGWEPWRIPGYSSKIGMILQDSQQLVKSISSEVEE